MKYLKSFMKLVELPTKIASIFPFILGNLFAIYRYDSFKSLNMIVMLISLLCIDMATTTINNYFDYKKAIKKHGYGFESHNAIVSDDIKEKTVITIIISLIFIGIISGLYLVYLTDYVVLLIGVISFVVGIIYSSGPISISRTPFGEIFSGVFMGLVITFLAVYIHIYELQFIGINVSLDEFVVRLDWFELLVIGFLSMPMVLGISNIMLANNICDMEDDIENKRYTLPIYVGKNIALQIYKWSYRAILIAFVVLVLLKVISIWSLIFLIVLVPIETMTKGLLEKQDKATTFVNAVKSFTLVGVTMNLMIVLNMILK